MFVTGTCLPFGDWRVHSFTITVADELLCEAHALAVADKTVNSSMKMKPSSQSILCEINDKYHVVIASDVYCENALMSVEE